LEAKGGQFVEGLASDEIVTRGIRRRKVSNYCFYLGSFEVIDRGFRLERGFL
jgi:hypothetical protein